MYPDLIEIGGLRIATFGAFMAVAFLVGGAVFARELRRKGEHPETAWSLVGWAVLGGIAGAKLYYLVLNWHETFAAPKQAILSRAGLVWYGGFFGAAALILWRLWRDRRAMLLYADAIAPALTLAYGMGRLGCFMAGDDYGRPGVLRRDGGTFRPPAPPGSDRVKNGAPIDKSQFQPRPSPRPQPEKPCDPKPQRSVCC